MKWNPQEPDVGKFTVWLYQLLKPYFEHVLDRLFVVCQNVGVDLFLTTGESLAEWLLKLHKPEVRAEWLSTVAPRIFSTYNQPLAYLERIGPPMQVHSLTYHRLTRRSVACGDVVVS